MREIKMKWLVPATREDMEPFANGVKIVSYDEVMTVAKGMYHTDRIAFNDIFEEYHDKSPSNIPIGILVNEIFGTYTTGGSFGYTSWSIPVPEAYQDSDAAISQWISDILFKACS